MAKSNFENCNKDAFIVVENCYARQEIRLGSLGNEIFEIIKNKDSLTQEEYDSVIALLAKHKVDNDITQEEMNQLHSC